MRSEEWWSGEILRLSPRFRTSREVLECLGSPSVELPEGEASCYDVNSGCICMSIESVFP